MANSLTISVGLISNELNKGLQDVNNEIGQSTKSWKEKFGNISAEMTKVGGTLTGIGAAITAPLGLAVKAAEDERQAQALLAQQLQNVGVAYADVKDQIEANISATMRKTGVSDDQQREALGKLLLVTNDYEKAMKLLPTTLDLAASAQMDTTTAAQLLGRVMEGDTGVLSRYGIKLDEFVTSTKDMSAEEILLRAQVDGLTIAEGKLIDTNGALAAIQERVNGAAEAAASPFEILKGEMGNLSESIGTMLLPILTELLHKYIMPLIDKITEWIAEHPQLAKAIVMVVGAIGALAAAVGPILLMLPMLMTGMHLLLGPIGLVALAIMGIIALAVLVKTHWEGISGFFAKLWEDIKNVFKDAINFLIGLIESWANFYINAINFVIGALNKIQVTIPDWVPGIGGKSFGINIPLIPEVSLPRLKMGGIVASPTIAMIGEAGPEAVVPLSGSNMGSNITINLYTDAIMGNETEARRFARKIAEYIRENNRLQTYGRSA